METLESLKRRLAGTRDLQSVVKSMKALAAVKIRQYERTADSVGIYREAVELGLQVALQGGVWGRERRGEVGSKRRHAIVVGSDRGLCGQFNEEIVRFSRERLEEGADSERPVILAVGDQAGSLLEAEGIRVSERVPVPQSTGAIGSVVGRILVRAEEWRREEGGDTISFFHNQRRGGYSYQPREEALWPLDVEWLRELASRPWRSRSLPMHWESRSKLLAAMIRQHLFALLFRGLAESMAAEQASRLTAMQAAERDIEERLEELEDRYQQQRQRSITDELLDIISGRKALERRRPGLDRPGSAAG